MDDKELEKLAVQELLGEAKRGKERSETMGTYGWQKRSVTTNKRFLRNTLLRTLPKKQRTMHANDDGLRTVKEPTEDVSRRRIDDSDSEQYARKKIRKSHSSESSKRCVSSHHTVSKSSTRGKVANLQSTEKKIVQPHADMKAKDEHDKNK